MIEIVDHHHYNSKKNDINDRVSIYEKYVIDELLNSTIDDEDRESSIAFELMHHRGCAQFARILARKRGLPLDVCTVGALLHDIYVIKTGKYANHAINGAVIVAKLLDEIGLFSEEEKAQIIDIVRNHSNKEEFSDNLFSEFGKDVDVLDSFLYPNAFAYYLKHKKLKNFYAYISRAKRIWDELGIPMDNSFFVLDNYHENGWLDYQITLNEVLSKRVVKYLLGVKQSKEIHIPTFLIVKKDKYHIFINQGTYKTISNHFSETGIDIFGDSENYKDKISVDQSVEDLFSIIKEPNNVVIVWGAIGMYEKYSLDDARLVDFINNIQRRKII